MRDYISGTSDNSKLINKLMFVVVGARDFSPEITVLPIGTEVPCSEEFPHKFPFVGLCD